MDDNRDDDSIKRKYRHHRYKDRRKYSDERMNKRKEKEKERDKDRNKEREREREREKAKIKEK